jgi:hypothetical protein
MANVRCSHCLSAGRTSLSRLFGRRGVEFEQEWTCSKECLRAVVSRAVMRSLESPVPEVDQNHRLRIGTILVQRGLISREQLAEAIEQQKAGGGTIGRQLLELGYCSEEELTAALSEQQGVPWVGDIKARPGLAVADLVPRRLCLDFRVFPFDFDEESRTVFLAARSPIRILLVHLLRRMLGYQVRAFILTDGSFDRRFEEFLSCRRSLPETETHCATAHNQIAERLCAEADRRGARRIVLSRYEHAFWARLGRGKRWFDFFLVLPRPDGIAGSAGQSLPMEAMTKG